MRIEMLKIHYGVLLFSTTRRARATDQARGPLSLWTKVWPTQPVLTLQL